jgi:hypothetical protein
MSFTAWAEDVARSLLEEPLPRRWAHVQGVADAARGLSPILGEDAELLAAAAMLHDIGYSPSLQDSGFHPLDGARYLRDVEHADTMLCRLVAHHSGAIVEAEEYGLDSVLAREFKPAPRTLGDALTYCDMTTGPDGQRLTVDHRLADIRARYGSAHPVSRAIARSAPHLTAATHRVARKLAARTEIPGPVRVAVAFAF